MTNTKKKGGKIYHRKTIKKSGKKVGGKIFQSFKKGMNEFFHHLEEDNQKNLIYNLFLLSLRPMNGQTVADMDFKKLNREAGKIFTTFGIDENIENASKEYEKIKTEGSKEKPKEENASKENKKAKNEELKKLKESLMQMPASTDEEEKPEEEKPEEEAKEEKKVVKEEAKEEAKSEEKVENPLIKSINPEKVVENPLQSKIQ